MENSVFNRRIEKQLKKEFTESDAVQFYVVTVKELRLEKGMLQSEIAELQDKVTTLGNKYALLNEQHLNTKEELKQLQTSDTKGLLKLIDKYKRKIQMLSKDKSRLMNENTEIRKVVENEINSK